MFGSILIANRGEIAVRILRSLRRMGLRGIAVHSQADRDAPHVRLADHAVCIGGAVASDSYLRGDRIIAAALEAGAQAIHPGYGFLSENAEFAEACAAAGLVFIGPPPAAIRAMGLKDAAKALMETAGVPVVPGYHGADQSDGRLMAEAQRIGLPLLIKATAGGGGKGMKRVDALADFPQALASARREAQAAFGLADVLLETYVTRPRHIEVQVFSDAHGNCVHLFERDCSLQRRHQKVMEEAPAPGMPAPMRDRMTEAATAAARAVGYVGAGTVEFIAESSDEGLTGRFWFMEMNTRLQVEHPVTEAITGLDLVEWQIRIAAGEPLPRHQQEIGCRGHAVEARLYAEDPARDFLPSTGRIATLDWPSLPGLRIDAGVEQGGEVSPFYDPMIAKVIAHGASREEALDRLATALRATRIAGPRTNLPLLVALAEAEAFRAGRFDTAFIEGHPLAPAAATPADIEAALRRLVAPGAERDPWGRADAFQLNGPRVQRFDLLVEGVPAQIDLDWSRRLPSSAQIVVDSDVAFILHEGWQTRVSLRDPFTRRAEAAATGDAVVRAPMHGRLVAMRVGAGERVDAGQQLAVVEAMKMEHVLLAPVAGLVVRVDAGAGDQVALGAPLVIIHAEEEGNG